MSARPDHNRRRLASRIAGVTVGGLLLVTAGACGDSSSSSSASAAQTTTTPAASSDKAKICAEHDQLQSSMNTVTNMDPKNTTVSELQNALNTINNEMGDVRTAAQDVAKDQWQDVQKAYDNLVNTAHDAKDDASLRAGATNVVNAANALVGELDQLFKSANCS
jgi:hypothetical protein